MVGYILFVLTLGIIFYLIRRIDINTQYIPFNYNEKEGEIYIPHMNHIYIWRLKKNLNNKRHHHTFSRIPCIIKLYDGKVLKVRLSIQQKHNIIGRDVILDNKIRHALMVLTTKGGIINPNKIKEWKLDDNIFWSSFINQYCFYYKPSPNAPFVMKRNKKLNLWF